MSDDFAQTYADHKNHEHGLTSLQEYLKQIVFGGNDGIVTTFAIVAGFAGAGMDGAAQIGGIAVLLFGVANLLADASAMGLGEFLSSRSEQDAYNAARARELHEIKTNPEFERRETLEILAEQGITGDDAERMTEVLMRNPEFLADLMMQYELGMPDPSGENAALNGAATFASFIVFGAIPLIPYFLLEPTAMTFNLSVLATFSALVALGLLRWKATNETMFRCVGETVLVGGICAIVAFGVGLAFR